MSNPQGPVVLCNSFKHAFKASEPSVLAFAGMMWDRGQTVAVYRCPACGATRRFPRSPRIV